MPPEIRLLLTTCPPDQAERLLAALLGERLIACGNLIPTVHSRYWWQGSLCADDEALIVMETAIDRVEAAMARLAELHPYEVPKILTFAPSEVHLPYREWVHAVTRPA